MRKLLLAATLALTAAAIVAPATSRAADLAVTVHEHSRPVYVRERVTRVYEPAAWTDRHFWWGFQWQSYRHYHIRPVYYVERSHRRRIIVPNT